MQILLRSIITELAFIVKVSSNKLLTNFASLTIYC